MIDIHEFVKHEIAVWGEDYISALFDQGYTVVRTDDGKYKWLMPRVAVRVPVNAARN